MRRICDELLHGRGFALLRGLPVERWSIREAATAYFGIGSHFGSARSQNAKGHVLGHVRDLGLNAEKDPTARVYQTRERQTYHTNSCDVVGLLCLKTAKSGGASALVSSMTIYNEMLKRRPDLLLEPVRRRCTPTGAARSPPARSPGTTSPSTTGTRGASPRSIRGATSNRPGASPRCRR